MSFEEVVYLTLLGLGNYVPDLSWMASNIARIVDARHFEHRKEKKHDKLKEKKVSWLKTLADCWLCVIVLLIFATMEQAVRMYAFKVRMDKPQE